MWIYEINVKKRICELVATALHRLFHYFFSRHPDITEPGPKSSDAAPSKFDHRFVLSTVTLIPRCNIFVLSNDVIKWFYHRKKIQNPTFRAVLTTVNSANSFVSVQPLSTNRRQSEDVRSTFSDHQSISRWMLSKNEIRLAKFNRLKSCYNKLLGCQVQ